jgi:hypothetical protein
MLRTGTDLENDEDENDKESAVWHDERGTCG